MQPYVTERCRWHATYRNMLQPNTTRRSDVQKQHREKKMNESMQRSEITQKRNLLCYLQRCYSSPVMHVNERTKDLKHLSMPERCSAKRMARPRPRCLHLSVKPYPVPNCRSKKVASKNLSFRSLPTPKALHPPSCLRHIWKISKGQLLWLEGD